MRIRKNAKLGGSVPLEKLQTHVCQLNQSPWDVIPFGSDPTQFEDGEEDSFAGNANGSPGDSVGAVESVASMMDAEHKSPPKIEDVVVDDNDDIDENGIALNHKAEENKTTSCRQCKNNEANKQGQSLCEHNNLSSIRSKKAVAVAIAGARRPRARSTKKAPSAASNPYEFYYYSGFGPLWGKRRGDRNGGLNNKNEAKAKGGENSTITEANGTTIQSSSPCSSSLIDNEGFDYADDDDEEEDEEDDDEVEEGNGESGKKRMRKPVKARSLKSLM